MPAFGLGTQKAELSQAVVCAAAPSSSMCPAMGLLDSWNFVYDVTALHCCGEDAVKLLYLFRFVSKVLNASH